jgi:hypothetical protein
MEALLKDFATVEDAAQKVFGKRPETLYRWMKEKNGLPYVQLGGRRLIHMPSISGWLLSRQRRPNAPRKARKARGA